MLYTIVYHFITGKWYTGTQRINDYFVDLSKAKFQYLSVLVRQLFNKVMCYNNCVPFGTNIDKPIGYYFALNKIIRENVTFKSGLNNFGMFWTKILDLLDRKNGGLLNAILEEEMRNEIIICRKWVDPLPDYPPMGTRYPSCWGVDGYYNVVGIIDENHDGDLSAGDYVASVRDIEIVDGTAPNQIINEGDWVLYQ